MSARKVTEFGGASVRRRLIETHPSRWVIEKMNHDSLGVESWSVEYDGEAHSTASRELFKHVASLENQIGVLMRADGRILEKLKELHRQCGAEIDFGIAVANFIAHQEMPF